VAVRPFGAPLNIATGIAEFARSTPTLAAVVDGDRSLSFAEVWERSSRLSALLAAAGLESGDRVAVLLGNRAEYIEVAAALGRSALPMVPLNPRSTPTEIAWLLDHSGARALVVDHALVAGVDGLTDDLAVVLEIDGADLGRDYERALASAEAVRGFARSALDEREPFCIAYTSGTTGQPKGVVISHRSRCLTFLCAAIEWGLGPGRRTIAVAPLYHGAGFAFGYGAAHTGAQVAMLRKFDPEALLWLIERHQAQSVFLVPTHAHLLRALGEDELGRRGLRSLDTLYFNAAPLPQSLKEWLLDQLPHVGLHELYGSTEAGIVTDLRPADQRRKRACVGPPWFMTEVKLVADDGHLVGAGEPGELFSRSPFLMNGYYRDPAATDACTDDEGFLSAGDVAVVDEEGFVFIVDRKKDMIISGGVNVYPREVEEVLATHPAVAEVAVVGRPSERWGEEVVAFVVPRGAPPDPDQLEQHCRAVLAGYKIPRAWHFVDSLPRNAAGKITKGELRSLLGTEAAEQPR
jgi:acyl-CoA synthetase (AMP-forming)/AMP-acid ligase II